MPIASMASMAPDGRLIVRLTVIVCASAGRTYETSKEDVKLGRTADHRKALLANQVCSLIEHQRIKTTLAKAKAVRPLAEKMVTLGKKGSLHARRTALAVLRQKDAVKKLFDDIAPRSATGTADTPES